MKIQKFNESYASDIAERLELLIHQMGWDEKLNIQEFMANEKSEHMHFRAYHDMTDYTFNYFQDLFNVLSELNCRWKYKGGREIIVDFSKIDKERLEILINTKKYNV